MLDTHCHLYLSDFESDKENMIERANDAGVTHFFLPAIDAETHAATIAFEEFFPGKAFAMMGLHPCSVKENWMEEMNIVEQYLAKRKFAAIGECGLDFYWDKTFIVQQYEALERQVELAVQYQLPLVLHTRNAMQETIEVIKKHKKKHNLSGIFHCFSGSLEQAKEIIKTGFYLGIGGVVTYKNSGLNEVLKHIDLEHIVLETDAPYLTPVPHRGKRNESAYIPLIAKKIAEIKSVPLEEVERITDANARKVFSQSFA